VHGVRREGVIGERGSSRKGEGSFAEDVALGRDATVERAGAGGKKVEADRNGAECRDGDGGLRRGEGGAQAGQVDGLLGAYIVVERDVQRGGGIHRRGREGEVGFAEEDDAIARLRAVPLRNSGQGKAQGEKGKEKLREVHVGIS